MKLLYLLISIFVFFFTYTSNSISQETYGLCSPLISGNESSVTVSCILENQKIKIAKYTTEIPSLFSEKVDSKQLVKYNEDFYDFLIANDGKIVHIDTYFYNRNGYNAEVFDRSEGDAIRLSFQERVNGELYGGFEVTIPATSPEVDLAFHHVRGTMYIDGFFVSRRLDGMWQGWLVHLLEYVPRQNVLFSEKFAID